MRKSNFEADTNMTDMVCDFLIGIAVVILSYLFFGRSGEFSRFFCYGFAFSVIFILEKKDAGLYDRTRFFYIDRTIKKVTFSWMVAGYFASLHTSERRNKAGQKSLDLLCDTVLHPVCDDRIGKEDAESEP